MVNAKKVENKLAGLIIGECSRPKNPTEKQKKDWNRYMRTRQRLIRLKKIKPEVYNKHLNAIVAELNLIKIEVNP